MPAIKAESALFITLGEGGMGKSGCLPEGDLLFGYQK